MSKPITLTEGKYRKGGVNPIPPEGVGPRPPRPGGSAPLYDVVGVSLNGSRSPKGTVRIMATRETREEAEAFINMAVMRRGVEEEFFAKVPTGMYQDGDVWAGNKP